jgi:hypothetical protein
VTMALRMKTWRRTALTSASLTLLTASTFATRPDSFYGI